MNKGRGFLRKWILYARTLLIGTTGAVLFNLLHIPLAWMLGAMTAVLIVQNLSTRKKDAIADGEAVKETFAKSEDSKNVKGNDGERIKVHVTWRNGAMLVIGCMIGTSFTAEAASELLFQLPSMLVTNILLLIFCLLIGWWGAKWTGMSIQSGMIGNVPGGLTHMVALSEEIKEADMTVVALMQTIRLMAVIFIVPVLVVHGISRSVTEIAAGNTVMSQATAPFILMPVQSWANLIGCLVVCYIGAQIAAKLRFPTPFLLGPVLVTALWGGIGLPVPLLPELMLILAQLFIGCYVGAGMQFERGTSWGKLIPLSIIAAVLAVLFSFVVGYGLTIVHSMSVATAFLSVAPGGMAEMGLTASLVNADLSIVSSYQLFRILFILFVVPPFLRWLLMKRGFGKKQSGAGKSVRSLQN